jgi:hypothetical protein
MSSYAVVSIAGFELFSTQNHFYEWHVTKADRKIENERFFYEIPLSKLMRRLELSGTNLASARREFETAVKKRIAQIEVYGHPVPDGEDLQADLLALKNANFEQWRTKLKHIVENDLGRASEFDEPEDHDCPILNILLRTPCYQKYSDDAPFCDESDVLPVNWPCATIDAFARTLIDLVEPNSSCMLDVTDLVEGGWTSEFDDLSEHQSRCTRIFEYFEQAVVDIESLLLLAEHNQTLLRLLHGNAITAMEAYLGDTIRKQVLSRPALMRRFVETNFELREKKFAISELYNVHDAIKETVSELLDKTVFHQLERVIGLYKNVLHVDFPQANIGTLMEAIATRHDIVHRNGKTVSGKMVMITPEGLRHLLETITATMKSVDKQVQDGLLDEIEIDEEPVSASI